MFFFLILTLQPSNIGLLAYAVVVLYHIYSVSQNKNLSQTFSSNTASATPLPPPTTQHTHNPNTKAEKKNLNHYLKAWRKKDPLN